MAKTKAEIDKRYEERHKEERKVPCMGDEHTTQVRGRDQRIFECLGFG